MKKSISLPAFLFPLFVLSFFLLGNSRAYAQAAVPKTSWTINPNEQKVFIENKGQYDGRNKLNGSAILYGVENLGLQIYFTKKGLTYRTDKTIFEGEKEIDKFEFGKEGRGKDEYEREKREIEERKKETKHISSLMHLTWLNSNPNARVIVEEVVPEYFNYMAEENAMQKSIYGARGYKKLLYQDLYPGIDVEYIFHPLEGIKYSLILHPGSDASQVKMQYSGNNNPYKDDLGNIHVQTLAGDMIDHAPKTFYASDNSSISSSFEIEKNVVSFQLSDYDHSQNIIIDPWTIAPAFAGGDNKVLDVQHDAAGNIYVYGSQNPYKVRKYTSAGVAVWTFNTANSDGAGDIATDPAGNTYCTKGGNSACFVIKLDPTGTLLFSTPTSALEMWRLTFNYNYTTLLVAGAFMNGSTGNLAYINLNTGALNTISDIGGDLRALCANPNGNFHALVATVTAVTGISPALAQIWGTNATYAASYNPGPNYTNSYPTWPVSGQNALAGFCGNLFLFNGATIYKYNASTGASVGLPTAVAGGALENNSGIVTDACGNVYVGTQTSVIKYNPALTQTGSAATAGAVYDITINTNGDVIACGNNFVAALNIGGCAPLAVTATSTASCGGNTGAITATATGGSPAYTYSWSPGGQTTQTVTNLPAGTYTVVVKDASACVSATTTVTIVSTPLNVTASTASVTLCAGQSTILTGGGATTYTWSANAGSVATQTASVTPPTGTTVYTVTGTSAGCTNTATVSVTANALPSVTATAATPTLCSGQSTILTASGATNYTWSANAGSVTTSTVNVSPPSGITVYTVTGANGSCSATQTVSVSVTPIPTVSATAASPTICAGQNTTLTASGATNYTWSANAGSATTNTVSVTPASTTIYTVTGTNAGCTSTQTVSVNVTPLPSLTITANPASLCNGQSTVLTASGATTYTWSANAGGGNTSTVTVTPGSTTTYTLSGTQSGCSDNTTLTVNVGASLNVIITSVPNSLCSGQTAILTASGASTYTWSANTGSATTTTVSVSPNTTTTYSVIGNNAGCTGTQSFTLSVTPTPTLTSSASPIAICSGQSSTLSASGATTYTWSTNAGSATTNTVSVSPNTSTTYTVTGDNSGCTVTQTVNVSVTTTPTVAVNLSSPVLCSSQSATLTASGATTYTWSANAGSATTNTVSVSPNATITYTVTGDNGNGCTDTQTITVTVNPTPTVTAGTSATPICSGQNIILTANGATTYTWSANAGSATTNTVSISPASTTVYTVTGLDNGCVNSATVSVTVNPLPVVTANSASICVGQQTATLTANGATTYSWNPSSGLSSSTGSSVTANPNATTNYTVTGTDANNCVNTTTLTVVVNQLPNVTASSGTICAGSSTVLNAGGATNYNWSPATGLSSTSGNSVTANPNATTNYTITGTDVNGCVNTATTSVTVNPIPNVTANAGPQSICSGQSSILTANGASTYTWSANANSATTTTVSITPPSTDTYTVTGIDANGCTATGVITVTVNPIPTLNVVAGQTVCAGGNINTISFSASGGATVGWTNTNINIGIAANGTGNINGYVSPNVIVQQAGVITATPVDMVSGCIGTSQSFTIVVNPDPVINGPATVDSAKCGNLNGDVLGLTAGGGTPGYTYQWSQGGNAIAGATAANLTGVGAGIYDLVVTDANQCTATSGPYTIGASVAVVAAFNPSPSSGTAPLNVTFTNGSVNATNYNWNFGNGASSGSVNPATVYSSAGIYSVTLIASGGGCSDTAYATILVDEQIVLVVPNVFSPNGDGINDVFSITATGITTLSCEIFNRWGQKIYTIGSSNGKWDGALDNGNSATEGTYYYMIKATSYDGKSHDSEGYITLVR